MGERTKANPEQLGDAINRATRSLHASLNKHILLRLPLAIPPKTTSPLVYASGLLHLAPIYITFESLWLNLIRSPACEVNNSDRAPHEGVPPMNVVRSVLDRLYLPGLARSMALRSDLGVLTGWTDSAVDAELQAVARTGELGHFIEHIRLSVQKAPHVLIAYAWIFYMALLSGGRFIRDALVASGNPDFWLTRGKRGGGDAVRTEAGPIACPAATTISSPSRSSKRRILSRSRSSTASDDESPNTTADPPLSFFRFATPHDGEDLKVEFKGRLDEVRARLLPNESADVITEAQVIFGWLMRVVGQLDGLFGTLREDGHPDCTMSPKNPHHTGTSKLGRWMTKLLGLGASGAGGGDGEGSADSTLKYDLSTRFALGQVRDSLSVAKERSHKTKARNNSGGDEEATAPVVSTASVTGEVSSPAGHGYDEQGKQVKKMLAVSAERDQQARDEQSGSGTARHGIKFATPLKVPDRSTVAASLSDMNKATKKSSRSDRARNFDGAEEAEKQPRFAPNTSRLFDHVFDVLDDRDTSSRLGTGLMLATWTISLLAISLALFLAGRLLTVWCIVMLVVPFCGLAGVFRGCLFRC